MNEWMNECMSVAQMLWELMTCLYVCLLILLICWLGFLLVSLQNGFFFYKCICRSKVVLYKPWGIYIAGAEKEAKLFF
jgi:hypothetical protein